MNPSGLCKCNCGGTASRAERTYTRENIKKGEFRDFILGHHARVRSLIRPQQNEKRSQIKIVIQHLMTHRSIKEIANEMNLSSSAIKYYTAKIYRAAGVLNRIEFMAKRNEKPRKEKWALYLDAPDIRAVRELSRKSRIPCSVFVREAIHDLLSKYGVYKGGLRSF